MTDCKGVTTSMCSNSPPEVGDGSPPVDASLYRCTTGKWQYLSFMRPDVAFAVNKLSQFMQSPSLEHWKAVKRVLQYLKPSSTSCLQIPSHFDTNMYMYADVDWTGNPYDKISTFGYILILGPNSVCWSSKKQHLVDRSSTEVEYKSVANVLSELTWVHNLLTEFANAKHFL
ncbi:secreted RxLR effector protein 161-like [Solanum lycopersicum]|uniref:secreted RxLR effector protein 161-like n=1 Tax=Solanum lycopersicum TaxID=4081 RepID=UPI0002BC8CB9